MHEEHKISLQYDFLAGFCYFKPVEWKTIPCGLIS